MSDRYGTADGFRAYHTARGRSVDAYDDDDIEPMLLVGSEWLDGAYRDEFMGNRLLATQEREWPRTGCIDFYGHAVPSDTVPLAIERATYEVAYRELVSPGTVNRDASPKPYKRVAIEGAISVEYGDQSASAVATQMPIIGQILMPLLGMRGVGGSSMISGHAVRA